MGNQILHFHRVIRGHLSKRHDLSDINQVQNIVGTNYFWVSVCDEAVVGSCLWIESVRAGIRGTRPGDLGGPEGA